MERRGSTTPPPQRRSSVVSPVPVNALNLQAMEDQLRSQIEPAFFEDEERFKPFSQVIEILAIALENSDANDGGGGEAAEELEGNPLYENVQRQLRLCSEVVEKITVEHHSSLNSSVQAMGGVARHYDQTRRNVGRLREQVKECKALLQTGAGQSDVKELWQRRRQHAHVLHLLDQLDLLRDAPTKFDRLVRQKRFVAAVQLLNGALDAIFSPDLVDVPAVAGVRDELLGRKETLLERLVREVSDALFLRTAVGLRGDLDRAIRGGAAPGGDAAAAAGSRRRRRTGGHRRSRTGGDNWDGRSAASGSTLLSDDAPANAPVRGGGGRPRAAGDLDESGSGGGGAGSGASRRGGGGGLNGQPGQQRIEAWAGLRMDLTPVDEAAERAMEDPSHEFGTYMRLLVEAVRRLRNVDDSERYLMERLQDEVEALSASHMRACMAGRALPAAGNDLALTLGGGGGNSAAGGGGGWQTQQQMDAAEAARLTQYLRLAFDAFMRVVRHCVYFVKLSHEAKLRTLKEASAEAAAAADAAGAPVPSAPIYDYDAPYSDALVRAVWAYMQRHLRSVLDRHVSDATAGGGGPGTPNSNTGAGGLGGSGRRDGGGGGGAGDLFGRMAQSRRAGKAAAGGGYGSNGRGNGSNGNLNENGTLFASTVGELDREQNAEFCRSCVLAPPSPMALTAVFLPTLRFVEAGQSALRLLRKELAEAASQRRNVAGGGLGGGMSGSSGGGGGDEDSDSASLAEFLSQAVQERLLPCIMRDSNAAYARVCGDPDAFFPNWSGGGTGAAGSSSGGKGSGGGAGAGKAGEGGGQAPAATAAVAVARPNKAAQVLYAQAKPIFRAVLQIPTYMEKVSAVLEITLDNFLGAARNKFSEFVAGTTARERLDKGGDRLRELLRRDAQYLRYKRAVNGGRLPAELKLGAPESMSPSRQRAAATRKVVGGRLAAGLGLGAAARLDADPSGGLSPMTLASRTLPGNAAGGGGGGIGGTSAEEEADDVFESEFMLLRELWQFDCHPFILTRKGLMTLRHQQAVASLAYSCDWMAHRVLRMCATLKADGGAAAAAAAAATAASAAAAGGGASSSGLSSAKALPAQRGWGRGPAAARGEAAAGEDTSGSSNSSGAVRGAAASSPGERLLDIARRLSSLADDCLLTLRLEMLILVALHMQQLPAIDLDVERGKASTTAMSLGRVDDACVVDMNRALRDMQEAISPIEPKAHMGLIAPREFFAYVAAPLPRLLPRLVVHAMRYAGQGRVVTIGGVGKLNKILSTLQQTVVDVTETSRGCLPGGPTTAAENFGRTSGGLAPALSEVIGERFARAGRYVALMSMPQEELEAYIRLNRTEFSKDEYRVQWVLAGPNRRVAPEASAHFDTWWASTY